MMTVKHILNTKTNTNKLVEGGRLVFYHPRSAIGIEDCSKL